MGSITAKMAAGWLRSVHSYRRLFIAIADLLLVSLAYQLAFLLRFDFQLTAEEWDRFLWSLPFVLVIKLSVFGYFHLYGGVWHYVSMRDILAILKAGTLGSFFFSAAVLLVLGRGFPRSVLLLDWIFCLALVGGGRLSMRAVREYRRRRRPDDAAPALIVGAGDAGEMLIREMDRSDRLGYKVVGFVDDDPEKQGRRIHGVKVVGSIDQLPDLCHSLGVQELLIAIPSARREEQQRILGYCRKSGVAFKSVPALDELLLGRAMIGQLRDVRPEELLGRAPVSLDFERLRRDLEGKRIMVTGAGGSIGSELCRQLATFEPETLILFERAENSLYFVDLELRRLYPHLRVISIVGDVLNRRQVDEVLQSYAPDLLYHAAAFKHVPLMEENPLEAIQNNVFGTEIVALASREAGLKKLVFISTDKAVRPVGVMGMTKRVAECLLLSLNGGPTTFVAVRFGNVLGSDGSVLKVFQQQIARGGPVTVTDPEATRYFMLLTEAVQLVLRAGAMGHGGEVFLLNMGEPVRILDLARNLIRLSGLEPGRNIPVEVLGLRPGERLREELILDQEELLPSADDKVFIVQDHHFDPEAFQRNLDVLRSLTMGRDQAGAVQQLRFMAACSSPEPRGDVRL
ncbi:MAG: polysaccharide biosynthesis protein [Deltaproteobacteria bacterium]|nr:polysaccharide biosynthesis protein [Deltaproteobacteria bacterium]